MDKDKIIKLIDLKLRIDKLEREDTEKKEMIEGNSYAISEGWESTNMRIIDRLEEEIENL